MAPSGMAPLPSQAPSPAAHAPYGLQPQNSAPPPAPDGSGKLPFAPPTSPPSDRLPTCHQPSAQVTTMWGLSSATAPLLLVSKTVGEKKCAVKFLQFPASLNNIQICAFFLNFSVSFFFGFFAFMHFLLSLFFCPFVFPPRSSNNYIVFLNMAFSSCFHIISLNLIPYLDVC